MKLHGGTQERAEHLYYCVGLSLKETAGLAGVNLRTAKDWSAKSGWSEKKSEYLRAYRNPHEYRPAS